jgi:hypothetical protein
MDRLSAYRKTWIQSARVLYCTAVKLTVCILTKPCGKWFSSHQSVVSYTFAAFLCWVVGTANFLCFYLTISVLVFNILLITKLLRNLRFSRQWRLKSGSCGLWPFVMLWFHRSMLPPSSERWSHHPTTTVHGVTTHKISTWKLWNVITFYDL